MSLRISSLASFRWRASLAVLGLSLACASLAQAQTPLLNVSYDVTRELYQSLNPLFITQWQAKTKQTLTINQSHGGSTKQARSVVEGLQADVVTMNQASDIDLLAARGLVANDWRSRYPNNAAPLYSTMVFLTRKDNPKKIRDWADLVRPGVAVIIPNPKTAGNGRYTYLAAWGSQIKAGRNEAEAKAFVAKLFRNVPVLDTGGRAATATFVQRGIGDVLVTFENEVKQIQHEQPGVFVAVYPSTDILAEAPVAVVEKVVDRKGTRAAAQAYLRFLYDDAAQEVIAQHFFRPRSAAVMARHAAEFPAVKLFTLESIFGSGPQAQRRHFDDGGLFDQIYAQATQ